jgi:hypothetical protein
MPLLTFFVNSDIFDDWGRPSATEHREFHRRYSTKQAQEAASAPAFAKSLQSAGRASDHCRNFGPHIAPNISLTSADPGQALALRLPASQQATAPVSPGRKKSGQRAPRPRKLEMFSNPFAVHSQPLALTGLLPTGGHHADLQRFTP